MKLLALASVLVYIVACVAATPSHTHHDTPLPIVFRADTRELIGFRFANPTTVSRAIQIINAAHPDEAAMCLYGYAQDTTFLAPLFMDRSDSLTVYRKIAIVDSIEAANVDLAGTYFVSYEDGIACNPNKRLIAIAHSHPTVRISLFPEPCDHSDLDAIFTHVKEEKYWFSLVFCSNSNSLLWADGRRFIFYFGGEENNSNFDSNGVDNSFVDHYIKMIESIPNFN